jgi:endonuclease/exonuclease/phosphatase family metal-dependent hydrolase
MRVMVWNVWWRFGGNWREREVSIGATLEAYRPDLLGLTESWSGEGTDQPHRLAAPCGMHAAWAPSSIPSISEYAEQPGIDTGLGLLSRWPIVAIEAHELPTTQRGGPGPAALLATVDHPRGVHRAGPALFARPPGPVPGAGRARHRPAAGRSAAGPAAR